MEKSYIVDIQNEYDRIDKNWLHLHYKISVNLVIFAFFIECLIGWIICNSDLLHTTIPIYLVKFLLIPSVLNGVCIFIEYNVMKSMNISQKKKTYIVSLLFIIICFTLFTAHGALSAVYFIFMFPILLTMIYADYKLTTITFISCMASVIVSELFLKWDIDKVSIMEDSGRLGDFLVTLSLLISFWAVSIVIIQFERKKNEASIQKEIERQQLQQKLQIDELTGIYNRFALRNAIKEMEDDDSNNNYVFAIIDIDNFKKLNDTMGHLVGDTFLVEFGKVLSENCGDEVPFRYGGDEFCILFKNRTLEEAVETCKKIQEGLKSVNIDNKIEASITVSMGISVYSKGMVISKLITNADEALYQAKIEKNRICINKD